jgi:hypothetical protein
VPTLPPSVTSVPTEPISQLVAVGGFCTMNLSALEFQTTELAPAQPWPVPMLPRSRMLIASPLTNMVSKRMPLAQRWCVPVSDFAEVAVPLTKAVGPVVSEPVTKSCRPSAAVESSTRASWPSTLYV